MALCGRLLFTKCRPSRERTDATRPNVSERLVFVLANTLSYHTNRPRKNSNGIQVICRGGVSARSGVPLFIIEAAPRTLNQVDTDEGHRYLVGLADGIEFSASVVLTSQSP